MEEKENILLNIMNDGKNNGQIFLELLKMIFQFIAKIGVGFVFAYVFFNYVYNIYFLSYWKIDNIFNISNGYINFLLYDVFIIIILIMIVIPLTENTTIVRKIELFMYFFVFVLIMGENVRFSLEYLVIHFAISIVAYSCCLYLGREIRKKVEKNTNDIIKKIYDVRTNMSKYVAIPVSIYVSVALIALINAHFQLEHKVIREDGEISQVVLYSTKEYYIVADCEEENNVLYINNNIQQKISTENVRIEIIKFKKVKKSEDKS